MNFLTKPLSAGLYFVATPIGSARDMTLRGLDILASASLIAAEDTRTARKLMEIHGVPLNGRQVVAFHDHTSDGAAKRFVDAIAPVVTSVTMGACNLANVQVVAAVSNTAPANVRTKPRPGRLPRRVVTARDGASKSLSRCMVNTSFQNNLNT